MKRIKKLVWIASLLFLVGVTAYAAEPITIKYWLWLDNVTDTTVPDMIKEYNATHPGVKVVMELTPLANFHDKLINGISAGAGPDISRFKDWWLGEFVDAGLVEPLSPYIAKWAGRNDVITKLWDTGKVQGNDTIYMMPHQFITMFLYYRADWFKEAGLEPPTTIDKFMKAAQKLTDPSKDRYGYGLRGGMGGQDMWLGWMAANGAKIVDDKGNIVINDKKAVEANQWYIDLFRKYKVTPPSAPADAYPQMLGAFLAGKTAMIEMHISIADQLTKLYGDGLGVCPMPALDPNKPGTMETMAGNVVLSSSKNKDEAFKFVAWLTEKEQMEKWTKSPNNGQLPVLKSVADDPYFKNNKFYKISIDAAQTATSWPALPGVGYLSTTAWPVNVQRALNGEITSQQMLDELAKALKQQ